MDWFILAVVLASLTCLAVALLFLALRRLRAIRSRGLLGTPPPEDFSSGHHAARSYPVRTPAMRTQLARIICLILLLDLVIGGGIFAFWQHKNIREAELLQREGIATIARVVTLDIEDDDGDKTYYLTYRFVSQPGGDEGQLVTRRDRISYDLYWQLDPGGWVEIIYAPSDPRVVRLLVNYRPGVDYLPGIIGGALGPPSLIALLYFGNRYRRAVRLDEEGVTTTAEVLGMYEDSSGESASHYIAYQLPSGGPFRQKVSEAVYRRLQVGRRITVRYLPDDPQLFRLQEE